MPLALAAGDADRLRPLREDLHLIPGPRALDGAPTWTLFDPLANRFFRVGWPEFEILSRWALGRGAAVAKAVADETTIAVDADGVAGFARFLERNDLLRADAEADIRRLVGQSERARRRWNTRVLKSYLFFRVPLVRPDAILERVVPGLGRLFTVWTVYAIVAAALAGLYLVGRQWDQAVASMAHLATPAGMALAGAALALGGILHEAGHAVTARFHGCRVPSMGVAFLLLWPVFYTDTTDTWRLRSRRARLAIGAAGMLVELTLAAMAAVVWAFLPDGALRSAVLLLAGTAWVTTLAVNLNPFMRFDGYFLLADLLEIGNLQERAFQLARWQIRRTLFGWDVPVPERMPRRRHRILVGYAVLTWIYRLFLFLGIALLVYHFAFKALGLVLFAVEIGLFVVMPLAREGAAWWQGRRLFRLNVNLLATATAFAAGLCLVVLPWDGTVQAPAVLRVAQEATLFAPVDGRLAAAVPPLGARVREGDELFRLESPDMAAEAEQLEARREVLRWQVDVQAFDARFLESNQVLAGELARVEAELAGLERRRRRQVVTAPFDGVIAMRQPGLEAGEWLAEDAPVVTLNGPEGARIEAYVRESDLDRVPPGAAARFRSDRLDRPEVALRLEAVERVGLDRLDEPMLASPHGGPIAAHESGDGTLTPEVAVTRARFVPAAPIDPPSQAEPGIVRIEGRRESLLARAWRAVLGVLIRESGF